MIKKGDGAQKKIFIERVIKEISFMYKICRCVRITATSLPFLFIGSCAPSRKIYFSAYLTNHIDASSLSKKQPIIYTDVVTNEGQGYNVKTGEFTAPWAGGYSFQWEFLVFPGGNIWLELQLNNTQFAHCLAHGSDGNYEVGSKSTIMNLNKGDTVRVVFSIGNGKLYGGIRYTGFSGFLIM